MFVIDVDDILVHAATVEEHDRVLDQVLERIARCGLKLNKKKCLFRVSSVKYLGQVFSGEGMKPDPDKVAAIKNLTPPQDIAAVRRFLGIVNYLGRYVPNFSSALQPINDLMKTDAEFFLDNRQREAFYTHKQSMSLETQLKFFDMSKPTYDSADASSYALGACLMHNHDGHLNPWAYASRTIADSN